MMSGVKIAKIWGIPIRLHGSWFLVFGLLTWSLSRQFFVEDYPGLSIGVQLSLGLITSLLFSHRYWLTNLGIPGLP